MIISVLIPTKNEPLIKKLTEEVHRVLKNYEHEIVVIDKSTVAPKLKNAKLIIQKSDGLGKAILEGLPNTSGDVIVTMDGDFSHRPTDLLEMIKKSNKYDIVIGSRFISGGKSEDKPYRKFISFFFRKFASFTLDLEVEDPMSGFAVVKRHVYEDLNLNPIGYKINMEIMFKGKMKNYKLYEVPIIFQKRMSGKSKVGLSFSGLKEISRTIRYIFELKLGLR